MKTKYSLSILAGRAKTGLLLLSMMSVAAMASAAPDAALSDLLEKGIYSEETKGDLDAAMQLYKQVIAEGKEGQAVAAQAQYRLGVCYYKKKNYAEATAAFEKLAKDYPEQKELAARAREYLAGAVSLMPAPWADGEEMRLDIKFPTGFKLGMASYCVRAGEMNGRKIWSLNSRLFAGVQQFSRVEVEADSFKPRHSRWKHILIGDVDATYEAGHAELKSAGKDEVKKIDLEGVVYDNEEVIQMMRRLPLEPGYKTSLRILASLGGGNVIPLKLEVTGPEKVETAAGTFDCYKVELSIHQTFWYSTDAHRYLVKFEAGGIVAELAAISQSKAGEAVKYQDATFNFSMTAPPGWIFYRSEGREDKASLGVEILDPEAVANGAEINVATLANLKPEEQKSVRDWADSEIAEGAKVMKDLKIRPDSWKERKVGGHPGLSCIVDYLEGGDKKIGYAVFSFGDKTAVNFRLMLPAKDFEAFRPKFDAIIDSYQPSN